MSNEAIERAFQALNEATSARINNLNQALLQIERLAKEGTPEGNLIRQAIAEIARKAVAGVPMPEVSAPAVVDNEQQLEALRRARDEGAILERKDWSANRWCFAWAPAEGHVICGEASDYRILPRQYRAVGPAGVGATFRQMLGGTWNSAEDALAHARVMVGPQVTHVEPVGGSEWIPGTARSLKAAG